MINLSDKRVHAVTPSSPIRTIRLHLLDLENGRSSEQVNVLLERSTTEGWTELAMTNGDFSGNEQILFEADYLVPGMYRISITLPTTLIDSPHPYIPVVFKVSDSQESYKLSLMISARGYTVSTDD